jgi:hypothetical protein
MTIGGIDGVHAAARVGHVHRPVDDDRGGLIADPVDDAVLEQPARGQRLDVVPVDLIQRRIASAGQIEVVQRPVDGLRRRARLRAQAGHGVLKTGNGHYHRHGKNAYEPMTLHCSPLFEPDAPLERGARRQRIIAGGRPR